MRAYCRYDLTVACRPSVGVEGGRTGTTLLPFGGTEVGTGRNQLTLRRPCQRTCLCAPSRWTPTTSFLHTIRG